MSHSVSPRLDTTTAVTPDDLQAAVDNFDLSQIAGVVTDDGDVNVLGVDITPGIVVKQPSGRLEAPATIYIDITENRTHRSQSLRAKVAFHIDGNSQVIVDQISAA